MMCVFLSSFETYQRQFNLFNSVMFVHTCACFEGIDEQTYCDKCLVSLQFLVSERQQQLPGLVPTKKNHVFNAKEFHLSH